MSADWAGLFVTAVGTLATAIWAMLKWTSQRKADRLQQRERLDALYLNPFLFAAEDLQSRLYNLLDRAGLGPLRARYPDGHYAVETLFLVARYFAWEQQLLRFTHYATDARVVTRTQAVRRILAAPEPEIDPWCIFRTTQTALGQAIVLWRQGEVGFADTVSVVDFAKLLEGGFAHELGLDVTLASLRDATVITDLPEASRARLADVQSHLVGLLEVLEGDLSGEAGRGFSVGTGHDRGRSALANTDLFR